MSDKNQITYKKSNRNAKENASEVLSKLGEVDNPGPLVKALAPYDLLVAWRLADDEQRSDLLKLADREQVVILVDLDCWSFDKPDLEALEKLIGPLVLSGIGGALQSLDKIEPELRTLLLRRNARIHLLEDRNEEIQVAEASELIACPDRLYYIEFPDPELVTDVERALWSALLFKPFEEYQLELECVRHEFASELEEMAFRWRTGRLKDLGFPSREEAMALLAGRKVEEVQRMAEKAMPLSSPSDLALPVLYQENLAGNDFVDRVIELLKLSDVLNMERRVADLGAELVSMTNRFITVIAVDISDLDAVAMGARWARDIFSLGLSGTAKNDIQEGARLLAVLSPAVFFQVGLGMLYPLQSRARALLGNEMLSSHGGRLGAVFDPPYYVGLNCLARDVPCRLPLLETEHALSSSPFEPRPHELTAFSSADDIAAAERLLSEAECLGTLLFEALECERPLIRETPASILVLTALANAADSRQIRPKPVTFEQARSFGEHVLALEKDRFLLDSLAVLAPLLGAASHGTCSLSDDLDPRRRLLTRLVLIGRSRLSTDDPGRVLLTEGI